MIVIINNELQIELNGVYSRIRLLEERFYRRRPPLPFAHFADVSRVIMSAQTRAFLSDKLRRDLVLFCPAPATICGIKILIDDSVPFGECKILTETDEVLR